MKIPLVAIEEHNEVFFVWYYARETGWLAEAGNILLHIDDHADLNLPLSRETIPARHDFESAARYAYDRIDIASFIWPSVYSGLFDKVYWLRRKHEPQAGNWRRVKLKFVRDRIPLPWTKAEVFSLDPLPLDSGEVACEYAPLDPGERLQPAAPLALDIDLDYFCVNYPPEKPPVAYPIEEFFAREIIENPYHWSRVEGNIMKVERNGNGHWLLAVREPRLYRSRAKDERPAHLIIGEALERLGAYLDEFHLRPALITICRSEYSGYTPRAVTAQIEGGVRELLRDRFEIEEHSLNSLLPDPWKIPAQYLRVWPW